MNHFKFLLERLYLVYKLGVLNVIRNLGHKIGLWLGYYKARYPVKHEEEYSSLIVFPENKKLHFLPHGDLVENFQKDIQGLLEGRIKLFFSQEVEFVDEPAWFYHAYGQDNSHWSESKLNETCGEDVKITWDISRFHWMQQLACAFNTFEDKKFLKLMDKWFLSWSRENPNNQGVNWACGQECSIRIIHILNASQIVNGSIFDKEVLAHIVFNHATRINATISYAISQDNNHGVTEAAALFICGAWLLKNSDVTEAVAKKIMSTGKNTLESRVQKLVMKDGGFSMYSTNYHRVLLNTLSIVEMWRKELDQPEFSDSYIKKCRAAISWLYLLVDECTGETINLGTNDGSNPFIVQSTDYRDYRPSIQFASVLILNQRAYEDSICINEPLFWLNINLSQPLVKPCLIQSKVLKPSGIVALFGEDISLIETTLFIKYPNYDFRPGQSDALHIDFWYNGKNIFRDVGSYSYNSVIDEDKYFSSIRAHNTIQVDNFEPMTKVGPFLRANWSEMTSIGEIAMDENSLSWCGQYNIKPGTSHMRRVMFSGSTWEVVDQVVGASKVIVLRWHLSPGVWIRAGNVFSCGNIKIELSSNEKITIELCQGLESRYYNDYAVIPVIEASVYAHSAAISTEISFGDRV